MGVLCLSFEGNPTSKTPLTWLSARFLMDHMAEHNYDLGVLDSVLNDCRLIEDF